MRAQQTVLILAVLAGLATVPAGAQPSLGSSQSRVDGVVTDTSGRAVPDLKAGDFEVTLDGHSQPVTGVSFIDTRTTAAAPAIPLPAGGRVHSRTAQRPFVVIVDDLGLSPESLATVRHALAQYIDEDMQPDDEAAILCTSGGAGDLEQLTSDKAVLRAAANRIGKRPAAVPAAAAFSVATVGTLKLALMALRGFPGRKTVLVFTAPPPASAAPADLPEWLLGTAHAVFAVVHTVEIGGGGSMDRLESVVQTVARETGGLLLRTSDAPAALRRALSDREGYYVVSYSGDSPLLRDQTRRVGVKVKRPELQARFRGAALTNAAGESENRARTSSDDLFHALYSSLSTGDVRMRMTPVFGYTEPGGPYLDVLLHVDARDLVFTRTAAGLYRYAFSRGFIADHGDLDVRGGQDTLAQGAMTEAEHREAIRHGLAFPLRVPLSLPGAYELRVAVCDQTAARYGSARRFLEVPDVKKGELAISGILAERPDGPEAASTRGVAAMGRDGSPAVRIFKPGETIQLRYNIYNLSAGGDHRLGAESQIRLYLEGAEVFAGAPMRVRSEIAGAPKADSYAAAIHSVLTLGAHQPPGEYVLKLTVTDELAATGKARTATQFTDFVVTAASPDKK